MLGDCAHQPSVFGEAATSPLASLSRRSTFDEDSFFSPTKPQVDQRGARAGPSPQQIQRLPTVHDKVLDWFLGMIENRQLRASACASVICAFLFFVSLIASTVLNTITAAIFSVMHFLPPFRCRHGSRASFWELFSFGISWVLLKFLSKAEQLQRVPWTSTDSWLCFSSVLIYNVLHSIAIMKMTRFPSDEKFLVGLVIQSAVMSAFSSIFRNDFQLNFSGAVTQLGLMHTIIGMFAVGYESVMVSAFREAIRIASVTAVIGCVTGLFCHGFSSVLLLFNISFHMYNIIIIFGQQFATKALLRLVRHLVMKPISFPLPPAYAVHTPTPEQTRTLPIVLDSQHPLLKPISFPLPPAYAVHTPTPEQTRTLPIVLDSQHPLLKLFAFTDLRRVAWTDRNRRMEVDIHGNWTNVSTACINILERVQSELQVASCRFENSGLDRDRGDIPDDDFAEVDREMLMMPHKSRKQLYSSAVRQRHRMAIRPVVRQPTSSVQQQLSWWKRFILYSSDQEVVSRYDASIVILAIE
ncbi:hypothetical protein COOONC_12196, partial [Cooperia oncophora]